ncbi:MAG: FAD-binding protein [Fimbriimonadaceae bacterium]|nr:FAD-binding protein [Fimbriimonadaceae bacterium]
MIHRPDSLTGIVEAVASADRLRIRGFLQDVEEQGEDVLAMSAYAGLIDCIPEDQVAVVRAGTPLSVLQEELASKGQCLPISGGVSDPTVGGALSTNAPHRLQSEYGSWRDWVLGMTVVTADGCVRKCGSRAVKNVAGYDVQKLFIGARGTLGVVAEVILKTNPLKPISSSLSATPADFASPNAQSQIPQITDPAMIRYMKRAKEIFDPTHKLNPGEMGIF